MGKVRVGWQLCCQLHILYKVLWCEWADARLASATAAAVSTEVLKFGRGLTRSWSFMKGADKGS